MLEYGEKEKEYLAGLKERHLEKYGYPYLSPSSINDFKDCSNKFKLRTQFKSVGVGTISGNIIHAFLKDAADVISDIYRKTGEKDIRSLIHTFCGACNLEESFDRSIKHHTDMLSTKIILGEVLAREKDKAFILGENNKFLSFLQRIKQLVANEDFLCQIITEIPLYAEVPGFFVFKGDKLVYGILDYIGYDPETNGLVITDYKSVWGSRSKKEWENVTSTFQMWLYNEILADSKLTEIKGYSGYSINVKMVYIELPTKYEKINLDSLKAEVITKHISMSKTDSEKYYNDLISTVTLLDSGCGYIGSSKYGCASCTYVNNCTYYIPAANKGEEACEST
jgi:hypothetical protein